VDFELTDDQQSIQRAVVDLAATFDDDYWADKDQSHEFPWEFYKAFADAGWVGIAVPEEFGGAGLGIFEASLMMQEIAASGGGQSASSAIHMSIFGMHPVIKHGSPEMKAAALPRIVDGDLHVCFGVTEPNAGSDTPRIQTFAKRDGGGGYVVNGRKVWISKALEAEKILLLTRTTKLEDSPKKTEGMTLFFTDLDRDRIDVRPIRKMGRHAVDSNELFIDDLHIPESDRVGEEGQGFKYLLDGLNPERILVAVESAGTGYAALRRAVIYGRERVVFGRPIGQNQGLAFPLADALTQLDAAVLMARKAAWLYDAGKPCGRESNMAKYLCSNAAFEAADRAVQIHGGFGYAAEYHVERYFRESRLNRIAPISNEMVLNYVAEHVMGLPRSY
jgi:acyl-CoA dehydrogenase